MSTPTATAPTSAQPFLLIFRNTGPENTAHLSTEQREAVIGRWNAWFEELLAKGKAVEGQPLQPEIRVVSASRGTRVVDGPFAESKEAVGGYVKLLVSGIDEALEIAQRHPGLDHGLIIEVRAMTPDCHLGVVTKSVY